jgi:hypothetical protein
MLSILWNAAEGAKKTTRDYFFAGVHTVQLYVLLFILQLIIRVVIQSVDCDRVLSSRLIRATAMTRLE